MVVVSKSMLHSHFENLYIIQINEETWVRCLFKGGACLLICLLSSAVFIQGRFQLNKYGITKKKTQVIFSVRIFIHKS